MTNKDIKTFNKFSKEMQILIAERRKANNYDNISQDEIFNYKAIHKANACIIHMENKQGFRIHLSRWINLMANSGEVEEYIINGMDGTLGAVLYYLATGTCLIPYPPKELLFTD